MEQKPKRVKCSCFVEKTVAAEVILIRLPLRWSDIALVFASFVQAGLYLSDFHWRGAEFDWRLATTAGMEAAKLVPWNSLLN